MDQKSKLSTGKKIAFTIIAVVLFFVVLDRGLKVYEKAADRAKHTKEDKVVSCLRRTWPSGCLLDFIPIR
jgi:hypothetical protein